VNTEEVARPLASVTSVSVAVEFDAKVALAPVAGAVNTTDTPATGFELVSNTVATSGFVNAVSTNALCPPPLVAVTDASVAVFVRLKLAGCATPETVAVTV
jgi:hypothetical protein